MTEGFACKARPVADDLRKRIERVLISVARQGTERFKFSDYIEPAGNGGAGRRAPRLDSERQLRGPEQKRSEQGEKLVALCAEPIRQPAQLSNARRRRYSGSIEFLTKVTQVSGSEALALETPKDAGEEGQVVRRVFDRFDHALNAAHEQQGKPALDRQRQKKRCRTCASSPPGGQRRHRGDGKHGGGNSGPARAQYRGSCAPGRPRGQI